MSNASSLQSIRTQLEAAAVAGQLPLATQAEDIVPGEGNAETQILLIGEAPGYHESVEHRPFVGVSGKLLRQTLTAVGYPPDQLYISNIVKARPPENRDPTPEEIAAYKPFLDKEIELINPSLIVTLGRFSMAKFLPDVKISQFHGRLHKIIWADQTRYILPMYHPAAALRATAMKLAFIADFEKLPKIMTWLAEQAQQQAFHNSVRQELS